MSVLAAIRPDDVNFPLLIHVLGAMALVGALVVATTYLLSAWRGGQAPFLRVGYRALLFGVLPAWLVTRVSAQIVLDKPIYEPREEEAWVGIGFISTEPGLLLIVGATVAAGMAARRALPEGGELAEPGRAPRVAAVLTLLVLLIYLVTLWAMATKPE